MADNKDNERAELHKIIWRIANELRGSVDGWEFKTYVLGFLFYRYISENIAATINKDQKDSGSKNFDYANYDDEIAIKAKSDLIKRKGFFMKPSELFVNVRKNASNNPNLNIDLQKIFKNIELSANGASSQANLKGLFSDVDVNSNRLGSTVADINKKLVKLLNAIGDLPLGEYQTNSIDAFGDAYEYLMSMYAANAGKSGGEYFTPQEVSELLARITLINFMRSGKPDKKEIQRVYDPACGSGSLLLKFVKLIGKENVRDGFYGQEINPTTYNLARINMFLHDVGYKKFHIHHGDTLIKNARWNLRDIDKFDAIVS
ncbi:type I restriction-modification system subunit M, partial [[Mycoplasma] testudinis]|uniref:type I restriction-modification system subunit M n=1 Tax=[Mycoplasma] testudinis TaxID=33924 RepID=UPI0004839919